MIGIRIYNVVAPMVRNSFSDGKVTVVSCKDLEEIAVFSRIVLVFDGENNEECFNWFKTRKDVLVVIIPESNSGSIKAVLSSSVVFASITSKNALLLKNCLEANETVSVEFPVARPSKIYREHVLSSFSSRGPTIDGRIKPDVLGPGHFVTSALSDQDPQSFQCKGYDSLQSKKGSSMSSAIIAGHAALVRQYFMQGWYPSGEASSQDSMIPSGSLLKAIFINSGSQVEAIDTDNRSMEIPSFHQGFGESILPNTLFFKDISIHRLYADDSRSISLHEHESFCLEVVEHSQIPLKITLGMFLLLTQLLILTNS